MLVRVGDAHQDQTGRGHAEGLAEVTDAALEPELREHLAREQEEHAEVPRQPGTGQQQERDEVVGQDLQRQGRQRRHDQQVERQALEPRHRVAVDEVVVVEAGRCTSWTTTPPSMASGNSGT